MVVKDMLTLADKWGGGLTGILTLNNKGGGEKMLSY